MRSTYQPVMETIGYADLQKTKDGGAITLPMGGSKAGCLAFPLTLQNPSPGTQTLS